MGFHVAIQVHGHEPGELEKAGIDPGVKTQDGQTARSG